MQDQRNITQRNSTHRHDINSLIIPSPGARHGAPLSDQILKSPKNPHLSPEDVFKKHFTKITASADGLSRAQADISALIDRHNQLWRSPCEQSRRIGDQLRLCNLPLISEPEIAPLPVQVGRIRAGFSYMVFLDYTTGEHHSALVYGDISKGSLRDGRDIPIRIHSSSKVSDIFFGCNSDSSLRINEAFREIVQEGCGIIIYLEQDGRGHGVIAQSEAASHRYRWNYNQIQRVRSAVGQPVTVRESYELAGHGEDGRDYRVASEILKYLGVRSVRLFNRNQYKVSALQEEGIQVSELPWKVRIQGSQKFGGTNASFGDEYRDLLLPYLKEYIESMERNIRSPWEAIARNRACLALAGKPLTEFLHAAPAPTRYGDWTMLSYGDHTTPEGLIHRVLWFGNFLEQPDIKDDFVTLRIHSACKTNEIFNSTNCECREELGMAMRTIQQAGSGAILYLDQEGRGTGIHGKMAQLRNMFEFNERGEVVPSIDPVTGAEVQTVQAYIQAGYPAEIRDFAVTEEMIRDLGISRIRLLTNNPSKVKGVEQAGFEVVREPIIANLDSLADPDLLKRELRNKAEGLNHYIPESVWDAQPPSEK